MEFHEVSAEVSGSEVQGPNACDLCGGWADVHVRRLEKAVFLSSKARCEESEGVTASVPSFRKRT